MFITISFLYIFTECKKDITHISHDYPLLFTNEVKSIDSLGVTLSANILDPGKWTVLEYGFIIKTKYGYNKIVNLGDINGDYYENRVNLLESNRLQNCQAYIITNEKNIYSTDVPFVSKGSELPYPTIIDYYPRHFVHSGSVMTIEGTNLDLFINDRDIYVNTIIPSIVEWNNQVIRIIVPNFNEYNQNFIFLRYANIHYKFFINPDY
jgi:hypothetical protein